MSLLRIARLGHPVLRQIALPVDPTELNTPAFAELIASMVDTMRESDGVGLAAPQVYISKRVAVLEVKAPNPRYPQMAAVPLTVLINPQITAHSDEKETDWEGCLSIPDLRGQVPRWASIDIAALDRVGNPLHFTATGFHARVIQHELDHLDGIIFPERMNGLSTLTYLAEFQKFWVKPV